MTMPELLAHLDQHPVDGTTLSAGSVNKAIGALQTILRWVEAQGYLENHPNWSNPAANMKMHNPAKDDDNRLPYVTEDLRTIFGSTVFCEGERLLLVRPLSGSL